MLRSRRRSASPESGPPPNLRGKRPSIICLASWYIWRASRASRLISVCRATATSVAVAVALVPWPLGPGAPVLTQCPPDDLRHPYQASDAVRLSHRHQAPATLTPPIWRGEGRVGNVRDRRRCRRSIPWGQGIHVLVRGVATSSRWALLPERAHDVASAASSGPK